MWTLTASLYLIIALPLLLVPPAAGLPLGPGLYALGLLLLYANLLLEKGSRLRRGDDHLLGALAEGLRVAALAAGLLLLKQGRPALFIGAVAAFALRSFFLLLPRRTDPNRFGSPLAAGLMVAGLTAALFALFGLFDGAGGPLEAVGATAFALCIPVELLVRLQKGEAALPWNRRDLPQLAGLLPSFLIYYGIPFRLWRLRRFYRQFLTPGEAVFDVGAHLGNRVRAFRSLDARVVAFEPQRSCKLILDRLYGYDREVTISPVALGAQPGEAELYVAPKTPTMSTLSTEWIDQIHHHYPEQGISWNERERVVVSTMEEAIRQHGEPGFVKIDVEGFESQVLRGLTTPVRALSFEFLPAAKPGSLECLDILGSLGSYRCNYSLGERMRLELDEWVEISAMRSLLEAMAPGAPSGDIYVTLRSNNR